MAAYSLQLRIYGLAAHRGLLPGGREPELILFDLRRGERHRIEPDDALVEDRVRQASARIAAGDFSLGPEHEQRPCKLCAYRPICTDARKVLERRQIKEAIAFAEAGGIAIHRNFDSYHGSTIRGMVRERPFLHVIGLRSVLERWGQMHGLRPEWIQPEKRRMVAPLRRLRSGGRGFDRTPAAGGRRSRRPGNISIRLISREDSAIRAQMWCPGW